jgi:hypothetical protein
MPQQEDIGNGIHPFVFLLRIMTTVETPAKIAPTISQMYAVGMIQLLSQKNKKVQIHPTHPQRKAATDMRPLMSVVSVICAAPFVLAPSSLGPSHTLRCIFDLTPHQR